MKKVFPIILIVLLSISCKSYIVNSYFKLMGVYDTKVKLEKLYFQEKEIIFLKMHHIGKQEFYDDVKAKIDSLKNENYYFFVEGITSQQLTGKKSLTKEDSIVFKDLAYKLRKVTGQPSITKNGDLDKLSEYQNKGIKFKEKLVNQPTYNILGLTSKNSKITDITVEDILKRYEKKYGEIVLNPCDFQTPFYEKTNCTEKVDKQTYQTFIIDERNNIVIDNILKENNNKIAIIFGEGHFIGIKDGLQKSGKENK
jgi:hypothetical protein